MGSTHETQASHGQGEVCSCQRVYWQRVCLQKLREAAADVKVVLFCKGGCLRRR